MHAKSGRTTTSTTMRHFRATATTSRLKRPSVILPPPASQQLLNFFSFAEQLLLRPAKDVTSQGDDFASMCALFGSRCHEDMTKMRKHRRTSSISGDGKGFQAPTKIREDLPSPPGPLIQACFSLAQNHDPRNGYRSRAQKG